MCAPAVPNDVNIDVGVFNEQFFEVFCNDPAVFPVVEGVVPFSCVHVLCHEQVADAAHLLAVGNVIVSFEREFLPAIGFDGGLAFLVETEYDAVFRKTGNGLLYSLFFLSNSLSGEYCHRLLRLSFPPAR